jgi:hypothetical protein
LVFFIMRQIVKSLQTTERYIQNLNHDLSGIMGLLDVNLLQSITKEKKELENNSNSLISLVVPRGVEPRFPA